MRIIALVIVFVARLIAPVFAQQAEIEAVNAKWIDFFNKGDFAGRATAQHSGAAHGAFERIKPLGLKFRGLFHR